MPRLRLTGTQLVAALRRAGFVVARIRGSHYLLQHPDGRVTVVPVHGNEIIGPGLLAKVLRDTALSQDDLSVLLK